MAKKNVLTKINMEKRTCYDLDDIININDTDLDNNLLNEKL